MLADRFSFRTAKSGGVLKFSLKVTSPCELSEVWF